MQFRLGRSRVGVDVPHLLVLLAILGFCARYLFDARAASTDVQNLLLIEPAALLAFVFGALILRDVFSLAPAERPLLAPGTVGKITGSMLLLAAYVAAMGFVGFDIATAIYVFASLRLLGERRIVVLLAVPILFAAVTIIGFKSVISLPMPLLF
jgi:hypothetical protein